MQNIGGLFQWLQSEACTPFYDRLTPENREDIVEQCMSNTDFMEAASAFVEDIAVIRQKLETKVGQLCKKMATAAQQKNPVDVAGICPVSENSKNEILSSNTFVNSVPVPINDRICTGRDVKAETDTEVDIEKGTHIGSGFYLKREGHLIKMTSPDWVIYY